MLIARVPMRQVCAGGARAGRDRFRHDEQRIGHAESDAGDGTNRRAASASSASSCRPVIPSISTARRSISRLASVFVAQAAEATTGMHMGLGQQITMMLALMVTSKGVAAVPRASAVVLLATLNTFLPAGLGPIGVAVIFGIDELMDMGRSAVNLMGNCLATIVVARWEGEFDDNRARVFGTPAEAELDLKSGDVAFAEAVRQGD